MTDILAHIDTAIGCQHCGGPLGASPSDDFCSQDHQRAWHAARSERIVGYREPWEFVPTRDAMVVRTFRLPPQSSDLRADRHALRLAVCAAREPGQLAACAVREGQLLERERAEWGRLVIQLQPAMDGVARVFADVGRQLGVLAEQLGAVFAQMAKSMPPPRQQLKRPRLAGERAAAMEAALTARRNRSTGPELPRMDGRRPRR